MENFKKLLAEAKRVQDAETATSHSLNEMFLLLNKQVRQISKRLEKKRELKQSRQNYQAGVKEIQSTMHKMNLKLKKQDKKIQKLENQINLKQLRQQMTDDSNAVYNIDVSFYDVKEQDKKRTGKHNNTLFDTDGNEYVNVISFPYVKAKGREIQDIGVRQFYCAHDDGIELVNKMVKVVRSSGEDNQNMMNHFIQSRAVTGFFINSKVELKGISPANPLRQKLKSEGGLKINSKYTQYRLNLEATEFKHLLELEHNEYLKQHYRPSSCVLTALINAYYAKFDERKSDGKRRHKELTYSTLCAILDIPDKPDNNEVDVETVYEKFIKKYNFLSFYVYDAFMNCILAHKALTTSNNTVSLRVMIKNNHLYQLNNTVELKTLQQQPDFNDDERKEIKVSNKYHIVEPKKDTEIKTVELFCVSLNDIFDNIVQKSKEKGIQCIRIITNENLNKVLLYCIKSGYEPKVYFNTFLFKLLLYVDGKTVYIESGDNNPVYGSQISFESIEEYKQFDDAYNDIYRQVVKKEYISEFHPQVQAIDNHYKIQPLVASLNSADLSKQLDTIDINKAYTHLLMSIQKVPVFHYFDVYKPYRNGAIEDLAYYVVECLSPTMINKILFGNKYNRTYGFVLKQLTLEQLKDVKVLYERKPYKIEEVNFKSAVVELYKKPIAPEQKKMIVNKLTGMLELKYNKAHITKVFEDVTEAECYKIKYGGKLLPVSVYNENFTETTDTYLNLINQNVDCPYYLVNVFNKETLVNGLYPIKDIIYLQQRIQLYKMYSTLTTNNIAVYGFKTDSIYTDRGLSLTNKRQLSSLFKFNSEIGNYKVETNKYLPTTQLTLTLNELVDVCDFTTPAIRRFVNEKDTSMINAYLSDKQAVMIKGEYPGVGKSTLCKNYDKNALFILPYNKLCQNLKSEGFVAITFSKVFGLYANDIELKGLKQMDLSEYKTVVFDEALLYTPDRLKRLDKLIRQYPDITFMATGDTEQRAPIGFDDSNYLNHCIDVIFKNQVVLSDIKRLSEDKDKAIWKLMKADIFSPKFSLSGFCQKYGIKTVSNIEDIKTIKNICYFNFRCLSVNKFVNSNLLKKKDLYSVGTEIICRKYVKTKDLTLYTNYTYKIKSLKPKVKIVDEVEGKEFVIDNAMLYSHFKLPYALTCDSIQGLSFGEDEQVTILDANLPYTDRRYLWTAITRCRKLQNLTVFIHPDNEVERFKSSRISQYFGFKCDNYKLQDSKANRKWKDGEFINAEWFDKMMNKQGNKCYYCQCSFDLEIDDNSNVVSNITTDRVNSAKPHIISNCLLACHHCNVSRKNTYNDLI